MQYLTEAKKLKNTKFLGRLAEYQYYNMDQVISRILRQLEKISF